MESKEITRLGDDHTLLFVIGMGISPTKGRSTRGEHFEANKKKSKIYLKKFLKILPGDNLLSIVDGLVGVCGCASTVASVVAGAAGAGTATLTAAMSVEEFLRALAMTLEFTIARFNVSDGELYRLAIRSIKFWFADTSALTAVSCFAVGFSGLYFQCASDFGII